MSNEEKMEKLNRRRRKLYEFIGNIKCFYCGSTKKLGVGFSMFKVYDRYWCLSCENIYRRKLGTKKIFYGLLDEKISLKNYFKRENFYKKWTFKHVGNDPVQDHYGEVNWYSNDGEWHIFENWHVGVFYEPDIIYVENLKTGKKYDSIFCLKAWKFRGKYPLFSRGNIP